MARVILNLDNIITVSGMKVKVLPFRIKSDSLSDHAEVNPQSEAGNRTESEVKQIAALPLIGRYYGELT